VQLFLNEQSLSLKLCNLEPQEPRGVFKTMNLDLRQYGRLSMFVHAESATPTEQNLNKGDLSAIIRIGSDFVSNYYEIKIPLKATRWGARDSLLIWPEENNLDFDLDILPQLKSRRNRSGTNDYYKEVIDGRTYAIRGNPNLGEVRGMLLGVQNNMATSTCTEVWFNELRLSRLDEKGGWAALGRVDLRLADLGNVNFTGSVRSQGFGTLEQRVNERSREDFKQFDVSANLDLGKLMPKGAAIQVPVYASVSKTTSSPEYDPYDLDIKLKDKLRDAAGNQKDSIQDNALDQLTIKTINFTNVKKNKTNNKKAQPWDISNIDLNYSFTQQERSNPIIESEDIKRTRAALGYTYAPQPKFVEPLKGVIKSRSPWLALVRDFNFNYKPSLLSFKADVFRQFGALRSRNVTDSKFKYPETFDKYFYFDRIYNLRWDLTRSITLDFNATNNARVDEPFGHIDTKEKKDSVRENLLKGGRTTRYHHDATLSYTLPTQKLPLLDWTTLRATYTAKYDWIAASLLARNLGNTILTGQTRNVTGEFNFEQLYDKWRFLKAVNTPAAAQPKQPKQPIDTSKAKPKRDPNQLPQIGAVPRFFLQLATSLKRVGIQYTEDLGTLLPGYLDSTQYLGMNFRSRNPGLKYVFGYQPDTSAINALGEKGLLTRDAVFNQLIQQRYSQTLGITAQLSPIRDLTVDVSFNKTFNKQYSELYKDTSGTDRLRRYNPYAVGSFSISYISYQTLFSKFDPNEVSETFKQFESNRAILSNRLKGVNVYAQNNVPTPDGYIEGYGRYAQDVLIPAFLAAYTNKDPMSIQLIKNSNPNLRSNPFSKLIPKPNWNITYNGLTRIPGMEKIFTNFSVRHGYSSTLSMNSFNTALLFQDPFRVGMPYFIDPQTKNYIPYYLIPNVSIAEQFSPLAELDMTFVNQLSARFEYRKSRQLSLSLIDYQLAENRSTEYTVGMNWRKRGVPFLQKIKFGKKERKLDNDVTFRLDYSLRDDATANSKLDQRSAFGTAGQKVVRLAPSIDYVVNNRVNLKFYFEQNKVIPKIATSAPITTTRAGVQMRIALAP
jgi:cell surface protein SprA